jgi:uncharacterized membrane protein
MNVLQSLQVIYDQIKTIFFQGILLLLPISFTILVLAYSFKLIARWTEPLNAYVPLFVRTAVPHSEIILLILVIFISGIIVRSFILRPFLHAIENIVFKIPLVNPIYSGVKQLTHAFTIHDGSDSFQKVVLLEFPRKGIYSIGFLTKPLNLQLSENHETHSLQSVFIPTTPNPTSGFLILAPQEEIIMTAMTRQEAISLIISGGIIQPERLAK